MRMFRSQTKILWKFIKLACKNNKKLVVETSICNNVTRLDFFYDETGGSVGFKYY